MDSKPPAHKPLNQKQLSILDSLYRFRFSTTELLTQALGTANKGKMNQRLKLLLVQGYIGRRYDKSYHLAGRYASYNLEAKGIKALRDLPGPKYSRSVLDNMYKDKTATERFINHSLKVFELSCRLSTQYGERIRVFTKSELARYTYFPSPRPDMYIRLRKENSESHYIIDILDNTKPFMVQIGKLKKYIDYAQDGDWEDATGSPMPVVILVCASPTQKRKLLRYADNELDGFDSDDTTLILATMAEVNNILEPKK